MASPQRKITGLKRRKLGFYLTIIKPLDLQSSPADRYAFRGTLSTRDEAEARIKAMAIRADLEAQWAAERERRRPAPLTKPTEALIDSLAHVVRHAVLSGDDRLRVEPEGLDAVLASYEWEGNPSALERRLLLRLGLAEEWARQAAAGDLTAITLRVNRLTEPMGLHIDWGGTEGKVGLLKLARVLAKASADAAARDRGELIDTPRTPAPIATPQETPCIPAPASGPSLQDLFAEWKAIKTRNAPAIKITERAMAIMGELGLDIPVNQLDRTHAAKLRAHLVAQGLRGTSVKNLISPIQALLNVGVDAGKIKANPWFGLKVDTSDSVERQPWRLEDLKKLAQANEKRTDTHAEHNRWLFPILLHTGCRIGEVAQLELADIAVIDGHWAIEIHARKTEGHHKRTVKTRAGNRMVPVHPALVALGFLEHVQALKDAGERFLFPAFIQKGKRRPGDLAGIDFAELRQAAGVPIEEFWTAHSIRHNVRSAMVAANINETQIDLTIGHENGKVQGRYSHAMMPGLVRAIEALDWSAVGYPFTRAV
ncbi:site-specific integrase [Variovorax soli]|uniref:site-specific integrase n=1 Tax=Variovorax soli TaxID=376815 RepID=UPI0008390099|nr:site-specific integrase [Variovorax soli]